MPDRRKPITLAELERRVAERGLDEPVATVAPDLFKRQRPPGRARPGRASDARRAAADPDRSLGR